MYANLFHFSPSHPGTRIETEGQSPFSSIKNEDDVWILVEGARDSFRDFHRFITNGTQMRVIVACLPYHAAKPPQWLERVCGQDYKMSVWSWEELFVVGYEYLVLDRPRPLMTSSRHVDIFCTPTMSFPTA
jgi:hypothetical protein